jgi:methionyl-tRNA formyltransferase
MTKIVFYGTGDFAATVLKNIVQSGNYAVLGVVTQPDRPAGRHFENHKSSVKMLAENFNLPVLQPESLKEFDNPVFSQADLGVVAEYGLIIPARLLDLPKYKTLNLHGSILPKYRGASPIQTAILNGDGQTGITLMLMDKSMDHGPTLAYASTEIASGETYKQLSDRLAQMAAELFLRETPRYIDGEITPVEQKHEAATFCKILTRDDGKVDFNKSGAEIYNQYRALSPWPGIWTMLDNKRCKLTEIANAGGVNLNSGAILAENGHLFAGCGNNSAIEILSLQLEGKKNLSADVFINGMRNLSGKTFA